ncbi:MAG TPA: hypothetical protein VM925_12045 [Labilithrix sp.]|jgi:hypothetical protein|nr:hypothetical protein [Labilithrix sp.]
MFATRALRTAATTVLLGLFAQSIGACSATDASTNGSEDDLTSETARARTLEFVGTVFVDAGTSDAKILETVRKQAQTAFGPLRAAEMAVNSRELKEIDTSTFVKRDVKAFDPVTSKTRDMIEVKYTYRDNAVVALSYATRSAVPLALMSPNYRVQVDRVMRECTPNDEHAREFSSSAWYIFEPNLPQCSAAIRAEQEKIDADRKLLENPEIEVPQSEVDRLYLPITAQLGADKTNRGHSYPDYHRLYKGGVKPDKLVISLVFGLIKDKNYATPSKDFNWGELMTALDLVMKAQGEFKQVQGPDAVDLGRFQLPSGRLIESPSFADLVRLRTGGSTLGLSAADASELQSQFAARIHKKWVALEKPIRVAVGNEAPRDFAIQILFYFGAGMNAAPHKFATKNSDVFIYNGHSSIGYGPLDPKNFSAADFPSSYQILWMDGCVSYNYYHKDYIPLKEGGTKNLDLVTNGLEAPAWRGGTANGKFLVSLLGGASASYRDLLIAAKDTEALRVVDGELDNEFDPQAPASKVTITNR